MISKLLKSGNRRWLVILPLIGLVILIILVKMKPAPALKSVLEIAPLVKVEKAQLRKLQASISGYGRAQAKESWQAVSEVSGRVVFRHADLEKGAMIPAGTLVLKIDPVDYQLKLAQAKSDLNSAKADAKRIVLNKNKASVSLGLEKSRLKLMQKELKRKQGLLKKGSISRSAVEQEQSDVLAQQQKILDLETTLKLIPNDVEVAQAKIQVNESRVKEAQRKLDKTQIVIPFDARITQVSAELEQVVNQQAILIKANHIGLMQIPAQFSFTDIRQLIQQTRRNLMAQDNSFPDIRRLNLTAQIKLYAGDKVHKWPAKVVRVGDSIDVQGNTVSLIVEMENNWKNFDPIKRPPVMNDMFVEVTVKAIASEVLSVPAGAVHGQSIYIVQEGVLKVKPIKVLFEADGYAAIDTRLTDTVKPNDRIIVTDLLPAIDGMLIRAATESVQ
jgi:hypothetical protein